MYDEIYANAYDALYQDKDYEAECDFLERIFACYAQFPQFPHHTILDLGCGTGGHALPLAARGYTVTGVDRSESMLAEARRKAIAQRAICYSFTQADIRGLDLGDTFDIVIAMFAVVSYQTTDKDLMAAFQTARRHLEPGGLFVFDCWYGPAVLAQKPTDRFKTVEQGTESITRCTKPTLDISRHTVRVDYKVVCLEDDCILDETAESHLMRFLFPKEIEHYLSETGFKLLKLCPFMELNREATDHDWNIAVVSRAI